VELESVKAEQEEAEGLRRPNNKKLVSEQQKAVVLRGAAPQKADARPKANRATETQRRNLAH
jgi:hypothetical protein